jgi:hypothetical protein
MCRDGAPGDRGLHDVGEAAHREAHAGAAVAVRMARDGGSRFRRLLPRMMRQQPADQHGPGQDDNQVCAVAVADHICGAIDRFVRRAVRGRSQVSNQFIDPRVAVGRGLRRLRKIRILPHVQRDEFSLCTSKFESDMPSHAVRSNRRVETVLPETARACYACLGRCLDPFRRSSNVGSNIGDRDLCRRDAAQRLRGRGADGVDADDHRHGAGGPDADRLGHGRAERQPGDLRLVQLEGQLCERDRHRRDLPGQEGDETYTIEVKATATNEQNATASATSLPTATVIDAASTVSPTISGADVEGQTLTAAAGITGGDGDGGTTVYQWQRSTDNFVSNITNVGTNSSTYTLGEGDENDTIRVQVSFTDDTNKTYSGTSVATATVIDPAPAKSRLGFPRCPDGRKPRQPAVSFGHSTRLMLRRRVILKGQADQSDRREIAIVPIRIMTGLPICGQREWERGAKLAGLDAGAARHRAASRPIAPPALVPAQQPARRAPVPSTVKAGRPGNRFQPRRLHADHRRSRRQARRRGGGGPVRHALQHGEGCFQHRWKRCPRLHRGLHRSLAIRTTATPGVEQGPCIVSSTVSCGQAKRCNCYDYGGRVQIPASFANSIPHVDTPEF